MQSPPHTRRALTAMRISLAVILVAVLGLIGGAPAATTSAERRRAP